MVPKHAVITWLAILNKLSILKIGWNVYIYCIWKERNSRLFVQKEESTEQILEHIKTSVRFRLAGLREVVTDTINVSLCNF